LVFLSKQNDKVAINEELSIQQRWKIFIYAGLLKAHDQLISLLNCILTNRKWQGSRKRRTLDTTALR